MRVLRFIGWAMFGVFVMFWSLGPLYWALNVSLTTQAGLQKVPMSLLPVPFTGDNYSKLLSTTGGVSSDFYRALLNSLIEAGGATVIVVLISLPAGYAFARWRFSGSRTMFLFIVGMMSVPLLAVLLPLFRVTADLGLMDSYTPIIVLAMTTTLPIAIWFMRSFAAALPQDIEAAARIDGAGVVRVLWSIVIPLLRPAITTVAVIVFLTAWFQFLAPLLFSHSIASQPITVLIPSFVTKNSTDYGLQAAAGCLAMLPPIVLLLILHRYLVGGILRGAFK